jgi:hypothetical protein
MQGEALPRLDVPLIASKEINKQNLKLVRTLSFTALLAMLSIPVAMAGATNKGDNTAATPGENSSSTVTPTEPQSGAENDVRKGTTNSNTTKTTKSKSKKHRKARQIVALPAATLPAVLQIAPQAVTSLTTARVS